MTVLRFSDALRIKRAKARELLSRPLVTAVGVGFLDPDDERKGAAVVVYTDETIGPAEQELLSGLLQETEGLTVPTRVERVGKTVVGGLRKTAGAPGARPGELEFLSYTDRVRPVRPGFSIGFRGISFSNTGTAGLVVVNRAGEKHVLGCAHVMCEENGRASGSVQQPGPADTTSTSEAFAVIVNTIAIARPPAVNRFDAAICKPAVQPDVESAYGMPRVSVAGSYDAVRSGWAVKKSSRTTGDTGFPPTSQPKIDAIDVDNESINYDPAWANSPGSARFENLVSVKADYEISKIGDSGSVWLKADDDKACLMTVAGSSNGKVAYCMLIAPLLTAFGVSVASLEGLPVEPTRLTVHGDEAASTPPWTDTELEKLRRRVVNRRLAERK